MNNIIVTAFDGETVKFTSRLGSGVAVWKGKEPQLGGEYCVEIEIEDYFEPGLNIIPLSEGIPCVKISGDRLNFIAKVLGYDGDGVLSISLDGDIVLLDVDWSNEKSNYVSFSVLMKNVLLYPVFF